jgi:GDP-L-fucose synthase
MKLKILVLGGYGFVGRNLVNILKNNPDNYQIFIASRANGVDLTGYENTKKHLSEILPDVIINCAAHVGSINYVTNFAADVVHDNVQMSLNIYKAVLKTCSNAKIINLLSNCSYPGSADIQTESKWWDGPVHDSVFSYGNAKRMLYVISRCYAGQYNIKSVNFLIPNTFGPGDSTDPNKTHALNGMILRMLEAQKRGDKEFEIWGTGSPVREWAYVDDVVNIIIKGVDTEEDLINPINLAQNKGYTIKQSAQFIAEAIGFKGKLVFNTEKPDGAPIKILDDKKFRQIFPDFVFFDHKKGIANTVEYYKLMLSK